MEPTSLVLGLEEAGLQEEILHFLDRSPRLHVVGIAQDGPELSRAVRDRRPDAAVVSPGVVGGAPELDGASILVVAPRETTEGLRVALRASARGFYLWPEERESLVRDAEDSRRRVASNGGQPGRLIAVVGARGGAGTTFLATNLAAALASAGVETALADLDLFYGEVTTALGISGHERTLADLAPVGDEVGAEHLERVLHSHPRGFRVLLAPPDPAEGLSIGPEHVGHAVRALRAGFDAVVLHLPRQLGPASLAALDEADVVLLLVTLDVLAFRDARRLLEFLETRGVADRCRLIVNRAARSEIVPEDAQHVFGLRPECVLGVDRSVTRAQNRGELVAGRSGRVPRRIAALAGRLMEGVA